MGAVAGRAPAASDAGRRTMIAPDPVAEAEAHDLVVACLRRLPPQHRLVVGLLLAGWSLTEAAMWLSISVQQASAFLHEARIAVAPLFVHPDGSMPRSKGRGGSERGTRGGGKRQRPVIPVIPVTSC